MLDDTSINIAINTDEDEKIEPEKIVRCKNCDHELTKASAAIEPHEHTFRNPIGMSYHIACYRDAPGALDLGSPTTLATWFPNYGWSFAQCEQCTIHIGWWFHGPDIFIGLIVPRLIR